MSVARWVVLAKDLRPSEENANTKVLSAKKVLELLPGNRTKDFDPVGYNAVAAMAEGRKFAVKMDDRLVRHAIYDAAESVSKLHVKMKSNNANRKRSFLPIKRRSIGNEILPLSKFDMVKEMDGVKRAIIDKDQAVKSYQKKRASQMLKKTPPSPKKMLKGTASPKKKNTGRKSQEGVSSSSTAGSMITNNMRESTFIVSKSRMSDCESSASEDREGETRGSSSAGITLITETSPGSEFREAATNSKRDSAFVDRKSTNESNNPSSEDREGEKRSDGITLLRTETSCVSECKEAATNSKRESACVESTSTIDSDSSSSEDEDVNSSNTSGRSSPDPDHKGEASNNLSPTVTSGRVASGKPLANSQEVHYEETSRDLDTSDERVVKDCCSKFRNEFETQLSLVMSELESCRKEISALEESNKHFKKENRRLTEANSSLTNTVEAATKKLHPQVAKCLELLGTTRRNGACSLEGMRSAVVNCSAPPGLSDSEIYVGEDLGNSRHTVEKVQVALAEKEKGLEKRVQRIADLLWQHKLHKWSLTGKCRKTQEELHKITEEHVDVLLCLLETMKWTARDDFSRAAVSRELSRYSSRQRDQRKGAKKPEKMKRKGTEDNQETDNKKIRKEKRNDSKKAGGGLEEEDSDKDAFDDLDVSESLL